MSADERKRSWNRWSEGVDKLTGSEQDVNKTTLLAKISQCLHSRLPFNKPIKCLLLLFAELSGLEILFRHYEKSGICPLKIEMTSYISFLISQAICSGSQLIYRYSEDRLSAILKKQEYN